MEGERKMSLPCTNQKENRIIIYDILPMGNNFRFCTQTIKLLRRFPPFLALLLTLLQLFTDGSAWMCVFVCVLSVNVIAKGKGRCLLNEGENSYISGKLAVN